ncbi:MAG TPA: mechanosensitive ion channel domain-containing protein [Acetobacteraceae bacterium]|nr:mechanosensitive ion channel domain-containing protein [Acetobacteraceae bacterium]
MRRNILHLLAASILAWLAVPGPARAADRAKDQPFLLSMPDLSSPRATIAALRTNTESAFKDLLAHGLTWKQRPAVLRMIATFDIGNLPSPRQTMAAVTSAAELAFVLEKLPQGRLANAPGLAEVRRDHIAQWRVPGTPIVLMKIPSGPRAGDFVFSNGTEGMAGRLYQATKQEIGHGGEYLTPVDAWSYSPGPLIPRSLIRALPPPLLQPVLGQAVWQWIGLVLLALVSLAVMVRIALWGIRHDNRETRVIRRYGQILAPVATCAIGAVMLLLSFYGLKIWGDTLETLITLVNLVFYVSIAWLAVAAIRRAQDGMIASLGVRSTSIDGQLINVVGTLINIAVVLFAMFFIADFIGVPLGPLLAGLGIGGLAVALAVRPTLENLIGGLTLFADRPVHVGDYCQIGEEMGAVEEIGLRTTKIRRVDDVLVTIPNAEMAQIRIINVARRRKFLFNPILGFRYETTARQLKEIEAGILGMLARHPRVIDEGGRVRLVGFGDFSVNLEIFAYLDVTRVADFAEVREELNFLILEIVKAAGVSFAFPSQTNYLARDTLPDGPGMAEGKG